MQDRSFGDRVTIRIEPADLTVAPGSSVTVLLVLRLMWRWIRGENPMGD